MGKETDANKSRSEIKRISPKSHSTKPSMGKMNADQALTKWSRRQDYHSYYNKMIDWELEDEMKNIDERLKILE